MEFRSYTNQPIELRSMNGEMRITGYAAIYDSLSEDFGGGLHEVIKPGAFDETLEEVRLGKREVVLRFEHRDGFNILASTKNKSLELRTDSKGLISDARFVQTQASRDVYNMIESGLINKMSFAFNVRNGGEQWRSRNGKSIREITNVNLVDVAPVISQPAYEATSLHVRSMQEAFNYWEYMEAKRLLEEIEKESLS